MFSLDTECLLFILHAFRTELPSLRVHVTKNAIVYPDAMVTLSLSAGTNRNLYLITKARFSNSMREYVFQSFDLIDFSAPTPAGATFAPLFSSSDYTILIHDDSKFYSTLSSDLKGLIPVLRKEFKI